jgi:hypothetical protein
MGNLLDEPAKDKTIESGQIDQVSISFEISELILSLVEIYCYGYAGLAQEYGRRSHYQH